MRLRIEYGFRGAFLLLLGAVFWVARPAAAQFATPLGGWLYTYEANPGEDAAGSGSAFDALDGTWSHDNGSDEWDGSKIGEGRPGGAMVISDADGDYLRLQDTGDPRDHGMGDPGSNRKLFFGHDLSAEGASATQLDDGVTLYIRARVPTSAPLDDLHPDGGGAISPWPAGGDGYLVHDGGKGLGIKQAAGGVISFHLALGSDTGGLAEGLVMNNLNGTAITGTVDPGEAGTANVLPLDPRLWHDFWITIAAGGAGTHVVTVYLDGSTAPAATFDVTAGSGSDFGGITYVSLDVGSTGQSGAVDVDSVRVAAGAQAPPAAPEAAFIFGSRLLECPVPNFPSMNYTVVHHAANNCDVHNGLAYDPGRGWGFEVIDPGNTGRNCSLQFGPFDDSPNSRNRVGDACPEQIYDSFIGFKDFPQVCDDTVAGSCDEPCELGDTSRPRGSAPPNTDPYLPSGGIFRVDVPNGFYRFVGVFGDIDNAHSNRVLVEDGGSGGPENLGANHVVLVKNFRQVDHGNFDPQAQARVGFPGRLPPPGDGIPPDPRFADMDENGEPTLCPPNSPALEVTQGYIRVHLLQANGGCSADPNGGDIVLLEAWPVPDATIGPSGFFVDAGRDFTQISYTPSGRVDVTLSVSGTRGPTTIVETLPAGWSAVDAGTGTPGAGTITFEVAADGDLSYSVQATDACEPATFSGQVIPAGGCITDVGGESQLGCVDFRCTPGPEFAPPSLAAAFAFGSRALSCPTYNDPGVSYTMVHHASGTNDGSLEYDAGRGWGFDVIAPDATGRGGWARVGPFDDSPNNRNRFGSECPEELYDSFIGFKDHPQPCNETVAGSAGCDGCRSGDQVPDPAGGEPTPYVPSGGIFRVDVPNGLYRFAGAFGEADNPHATRILAEDGGDGPPGLPGPNHVVLVDNHDQAQFTSGEARADCPGCGVFARVGFNCRVPPLGDGVSPDPQFIDYGPDGCPVAGGPESPVLEVTQGSIRFHLLQGNANAGPGGKDFDPATGMGDPDPNGADIAILELWRLPETDSQLAGDCNQDGRRNITDIICGVKLLFGGFLLIPIGPAVPPCPTDGGNLAVLDVNGSGAPDLSDLVYAANFLFRGGPPPVEGTECFAIDPVLECDHPSCP